MPNRRFFLRSLAAAGALLTAPASFAAELLRTPRQTPGPFYPDKLPLDGDNDLVIVDGAATSALGEVTRLSGRILDTRGEPLRNAVVEIWQVDNHGIYLHRDGGDAARRDAHFQGFGRFEPALLANTCSAPSSRFLIRAARRTSTLRSRSRVARSSPPNVMWKAIR